MHSIKKYLLKPDFYDGWEVTLQGWVSSNRGNKKIRFVSLNDGSTVKNIQIVFKSETFDLELVDSLRTGAALVVKGTLHSTPEAKQPIELQASEIVSYKNVDEDYPIQNQEMKMDVLRELPHMRHRTSLIKAIMLIRSTLAQEVHKYFAARDFYYMNSPIITSNDGEGAGETFNVSDGSKDGFFGKGNKATLGVTGQLHGESYAIGMNKIYTFAPTFRAENSNTKRHLAEFWMIEPEVAFYDLHDAIKLAHNLIKVVVRNVLHKNKFELEYIQETLQNGIIERLEKFVESPLKIVDYKEALEILDKVKERFEDKNIHFGLDLGSEHERYLTDEYFKAPVAVINFPKDFKAFYMHQNEDGKTVAAFDLLVPGVGEMVGGSQRESDYDKLLKRVQELGIDEKDLQWYLDLRRFGHAASAGFGVGFERLVMYVTGIENIRDVIPYPRTAGNIRM